VKKPIITESEMRLLDAETAGLRIEQRSGTGSGAMLLGTGIVFNQLSEVLRITLDSGEVVEFRETIHDQALQGANLSDVVCCIDHNEARLLGRNPYTLRLQIDKTGVHFECDLPNLPIRSEITEYVNRKDIRGCSFRFKLGEDRWEQRGDGMIIRHILTIKRVVDIGPVVRAAYPQTNLASRSYSDWALTEKMEQPIIPIVTTKTGLAEARSRQLLYQDRFVQLNQIKS
jgi:HK97 family phage prohead protease